MALEVGCWSTTKTKNNEKHLLCSSLLPTITFKQRIVDYLCLVLLIGVGETAVSQTRCCNSVGKSKSNLFFCNILTVPIFITQPKPKLFNSVQSMSSTDGWEWHQILTSQLNHRTRCTKAKIELLIYPSLLDPNLRLRENILNCKS